MIARSLREEVFEANLAIVRQGLSSFAMGNASGADRERGWVAIQPRDAERNQLSPSDMALLDLETGRVIDGSLRPSSDTQTHLVLYRHFPQIGGIVHTHSRYATVWAQAGMDVPCLGTLHADYFYGPIPCASPLEWNQILGRGGYENNTGEKIVQELRLRSLNAIQMPAALVHGHGPFTWSASPMAAVEYASVLEEVARMAWDTLTLNPGAQPISDTLLEKRFYRKHGPAAYYRQPMDINYEAQVA